MAHDTIIVSERKCIYPAGITSTSHTGLESAAVRVLQLSLIFACSKFASPGVQISFSATDWQGRKSCLAFAIVRFVIHAVVG